MKRIFSFIVIGILMMSHTVNADDKITIYTTVYGLEYIAERIGGDHVDVMSVFPAGADGHTYEPTSKEMIQFSNSDMFIYVGGNMESFSSTLVSALANQEVQLIGLEDHPELFESDREHHHADHDHEHDHHHEGRMDPHIWIDPLKMIEVARVIKEALIEHYPENEDDFTQNFDVLVEDLTMLDEQFEADLAEKTDGYIIVPHAAYGYWERYGIHQIPVSGYSMSEEPSQKQLLNLVTTAREHNLDYVLFEQNTEGRIVSVIQQELDAEAETIHNLEVRTTSEIENEEDYIDIMQKNLAVLVKVTH